MKQTGCRFSISNFLIALCVFIYILDKYVLVFDGGMFESPSYIEQILGFCGGNIYDAFSFYDGCVAEGEFWRAITYLFIHLFIVHLIVNMLGLFIVGNMVEKRCGKLFILASFISIGTVDIFLTDALPFLDTSNTIAGGASGAVFGLMGIATALCISKEIKLKDFSAIQRIYLAFYGVFFTYFMGIWTLCAHNIGFLAGLLEGFLAVAFAKRKETLLRNCAKITSIQEAMNRVIPIA